MVMVDPMTSLAFSIYSGEGVYALLLGSGISRPAGIMTGWDIVKDLIRKVARAQGVDCGEDPEAWYRELFRREPDYSELLEDLSDTPAGRGQLLRGYFEPTEDERDRGAKVPTAAHRAIARLVAGGYIRVIVTTNFDRLMERALDEAGVVPSVIASADMVRGAMPLAHAPCTVIKVHGDYLDTRLKNTRVELESYEEPMDRLLDQVFDEYGLIVCGWSGEWDIALRAAVDRCPNRRFSTYWSAYRDVSGPAKTLCDRRRARVVVGKDADAFFCELAEGVDSMADVDSRHPLTTPVAVATLKRYLAEDRYRIRLQDLVAVEVARVESALSHMPLQHNGPFSDQVLADRLPRYESAVETLLAILIAGARFGGKDHRRLWLRTLERLAIPSGVVYGFRDLVTLSLYPVLILCYGFGLAAYHERRFANFAGLFLRPRARHRDQEVNLWLRLAELRGDLLERAVKLRDGTLVNRFFPVSIHLARRLREPLRGILPDDDQYQRTFDRFEYLAALVYADLRMKEDSSSAAWAPRGTYLHSRGFASRLQAEIDAQGDRWPLLRAGLFDGSLERIGQVKAKIDESLNKEAEKNLWFTSF
jgi:hypothetical protein